jgi:predicted AAA+ superfamily ATPase
MPQAVQEYVDTKDFNFVFAAQRTLNNAYIADMAKYASPDETTRIMAAWGSIPGQLAKENHKFQYRLIKSGARAYDYDTPIDWLRSSGLINKCVKITEGKMPLASYAENSSFKAYMVDTGLLCSKFDITASVIIDNPPSFYGFKGALAENYVMQALINNDFTPYYWASSGVAELDFVVQDKDGHIIPIETKSSDNVKAKSLNLFISRYKPPYAIRISTRNFGFENNIRSVPLYAVFCVER